jgi:hypothetical protein
MAASTKDLIATAVEHLRGELPELTKLKLLIRLELRGRGDVQIYGIGLPGPEIVKGEPEDPRLDVSIPRSHFNELASEGKLKHWHEAFDQGQIKVGGDPQVQKLLGQVIERHEARARLKKVH